MVSYSIFLEKLHISNHTMQDVVIDVACNVQC